MEIKTKFNVGDTVFSMANNTLQTSEIKGLNVVARGQEAAVIKYYTIDGEIPESRLFGSKEDLANSIIDGTYNDRVNGKLNQPTDGCN